MSEQKLDRSYKKIHKIKLELEKVNKDLKDIKDNKAELNTENFKSVLRTTVDDFLKEIKKEIKKGKALKIKIEGEVREGKSTTALEIANQISFYAKTKKGKRKRVTFTAR